MDSLQQLANSAGDEIIVRYVLLSELEDKFADKNPKLHDIGAICDSIQRHGFKDLLEYDAALNDGGGGIVAGNGRLEALVKLSNSGANAPRGVKVTEDGEWAIPVQFGVNSRTTAEGLAYLITNNNLSLSGGNFTALDVSRLYDPGSYVELLEILAAEESLPISVDGDDLDLLVAELSGGGVVDSEYSGVDREELDEYPAADSVKNRVKRGQLWALGRHRLMCGDSTNNDDAAKLMGGVKADIVFTSPPYGAGMSAKLRDKYKPSNRGSTRQTYYDVHADMPSGWLDLMVSWFSVFSKISDAVICNVQLLADNKRDLLRWAHMNADRLCDVVIWDKSWGAPQMQSNIFNNSFEFCFIFGQPQSSRTIPFSNFHGDKSNIVRIDPKKTPNEFSDEHRAVFPIDLPMYFLGDVCTLSSSVCDPFCGTGTTLIACEKLGKKCYGMELSERYCDIIIQRWEDLTGLEAKLLLDVPTPLDSDNPDCLKS